MTGSRWLAGEVIEHFATLLGRAISETLHRVGGYVAYGAVMFASGCVSKRDTPGSLAFDSLANREPPAASSERSFLTAEQ